MKRYTKKRAAAGLTIVEVLVALAVMAFTVSLFGYFLNPLRMTRQSQLETQAVSFARSYLEVVRSDWQDDCQYVRGSLDETPPPTTFSGYTVTATDPSDDSVIVSYTYPDDTAVSVDKSKDNEVLQRTLTMELFPTMTTEPSITVYMRVARQDAGPPPQNCL